MFIHILPAGFKAVGERDKLFLNGSFDFNFYPIAPSAPSKSNEPKRVNLGGGERRTTTKWWL